MSNFFVPYILSLTCFSADIGIHLQAIIKSQGIFLIIVMI